MARRIARSVLALSLSLCLPGLALALKAGERWYYIGDSFGKFREDPCPGKGFTEGRVKYCYEKSECYERIDGKMVNGCAPQDDLE